MKLFLQLFGFLSGVIILAAGYTLASIYVYITVLGLSSEWTVILTIFVFIIVMSIAGAVFEVREERKRG